MGADLQLCKQSFTGHTVLAGSIAAREYLLKNGQNLFPKATPRTTKVPSPSSGPRLDKLRGELQEQQKCREAGLQLANCR